MTDTELRLDIGCGSKKKESFIGIDKLDMPGVDFVLDFEKEPLPFEDHSVSEIYSYHCLEHLSDPTHIFSEFGRVCKDGAKIEIWTPYAFSKGAFLPDHKFYFTEEIYYHMCRWYIDFWYDILLSYWDITEMFYICREDTFKNLAQLEIPIGFAIRYLKDICREFGVFITVSHKKKSQQKTVPRYVACWREGDKIEITDWWQTDSDTKIDYMSFHRTAQSAHAQGKTFGKLNFIFKNPDK